MARDDLLTEQDEKLLEELAEGKSVALAAKGLGVAPSTCRVRLHNIRIKYTKAVNTKNRLLAFGNRNARLKYLLAEIKRESIE